MAHLQKHSAEFHIIKCSGDNDEHYLEQVETDVYRQPDADLGADAQVHTFLVDPFITYTTREAAEKRAKQLSKQTPGNRYYVVETVSGFISRKPKTYKRSYR